MDQPGPSSRNVVLQIIQESPESPSEPRNIENDSNIPRVTIEIPLGIRLESSLEDEYEEPSSEQENNASPQNPENEGPSSEEENKAGPQNPDYGYDDDYIGDNHFTL